jgi:glucosylceramidase
VAQAIHTALTGGNVNGYVYWYGVSTGATRGFIQANGTGFRASKWLSAYRNGDGSIVVVALNAANTAAEVSGQTQEQEYQYERKKDR